MLTWVFLDDSLDVGAKRLEKGDQIKEDILVIS